MIWLCYRLKMLSPLQCKNWLTDAEWQYALATSDKRARQFCNGRALVKKMLQQLNTAEKADIAISLPSDNAPTLTVNEKRWFLSLSHSKDAIVAALSDTDNIGVDIEQLKPRQYAQWHKDYAALQQTSDLNTFYQHWTRAEAYSKYSGKPLLQILSDGVPDEIPHQHLSLTGYMLCVVHQSANAVITVSEDN